MASANIGFDQIPSSLRKPGKYFEFNTRLAVRTLAANPQRVLILAPCALDRGRGEPERIAEDQAAAALCGPGSLGHLMARAAMIANPYLDLTLLPVAPVSGAAAAGAALTFSGTAKESGVATMRLNGAPVSVIALSGQNGMDVASALARAVNLNDALPATAAAAEDNGAARLSLTAKTPGTIGNSLSLDGAVWCPGLKLEVSPIGGGLGAPDLAAALAKVFGVRYDVIVSPWTDARSLKALRSHLEAVSHPMEQREGLGVTASTAPLAAVVADAAALNSGWITLAHLPGSAAPAPLIAAAYGAVVAAEEDPARPLNDLELKGIAAPPVSSRLGRNEQEILLRSGVTPLEVGPGERIQIVRAITTYTKNPAGADDPALLDVTTPRTLSYVRRAIRDRIALRFPREKLSQRTPDRVRSEILDVLGRCEELEIVEAVEDNKPGIVCERDAQDPSRLNARIPVDVVNGLHVFAGRIDLLL